jgi:hypothetical protein
MTLLFSKLLNILALQVREIRTDFMCDLTDGHSLRTRQQYFNHSKIETALHFFPKLPNAPADGWQQVTHVWEQCALDTAKLSA